MCALLTWLAAILALAVLPSTTSDVIFRVPEVLVNKILVRHAAAPRPVGTARANGTREGAPAEGGGEGGEGGGYEVRYEEYFVEHDVSTADARKAARALKLDEVAGSRAGCGACSRRELEYCESRVLGDHCCCERAFLPEPFPWLPHTCYLGPARCRPLAHDCARYARLRDCCCYKRLADKWKGILSRAHPARAGAWLLLPAALLLLALRL